MLTYFQVLCLGFITIVFLVFIILLALSVFKTLKPDVPTYPNDEGDFINIGPECFSDSDRRVISWKGENYYRACGKLVVTMPDGTSKHCVKRVGHPSWTCEDYDGTETITGE